MVMLPNADVELTLGAEKRGNVAQLREPVVKGVDESDVGTRVAQIGRRKRPTKPATMVHW